ncbi:MAG: hypothetical protein DRR16_27780 [Candidatus Parabeggiatoa sp. nov. 3]|nr:MAG: hypothetical protein DRR16_27780 [Gammaproteobacteria bacterium]
MPVILRRPDWNACYFAKARLECLLFCEGPIFVPNLFNLSTLAPGIELLSEGAISILLIGHNKKYNRTISINLF